MDEYPGHNGKMETRETTTGSRSAQDNPHVTDFQDPVIASILCVDDTPLNCRLISMILSSRKYRVDTAADGSEALAKMAKSNWSYQLVITDHYMPCMTGLELTRALRDSPFKGKICVSSGACLDFISNAYSPYRVDAILPKPFNLATLRSLVERLIGSSDLSAKLEIIQA